MAVTLDSHPQSHQLSLFGEGRLALSKREAARALGVSVDFLEHHVLHELRIVRRGRRRLIPVRELERWLDDNACTALERPK